MHEVVVRIEKLHLISPGMRHIISQAWLSASSRVNFTPLLSPNLSISNLLLPVQVPLSHDHSPDYDATAWSSWFLMTMPSRRAGSQIAAPAESTIERAKHAARRTRVQSRVEETKATSRRE